MKVLLIFPPFWVPYRPYLSLPSLTGYLKSNGIDVVQKDFNIEAYDLMMSKSYLLETGVQLQERFDILDSKDKLGGGIEQQYYSELYKAKASVPYISGKIEKAKRVFRDKKDFYDINKLTEAREILKQAQSIISTACFPGGEDFVWPLNIRIQRSFEDIRKISQNREKNPFIKLYESHLLPFIEEQAPDLIGISVAGDSQFIPALTLSRLIKKSGNKAHITVGGYMITILSDVIGKYPQLFSDFIDSAVLNEGEYPLLKLAQHLSEGKGLQDVPNLVYYYKNEVRFNDVAPAADVNTLPTPDFDGLPLDLYLSPKTVLPILSSRGCYWGKCAFCSHNESYRWNYKVRDAGKVVDDMKQLSQKHGVTHFAFSDEAISPTSMNKLCDELINRETDFRCSTNVRLERQFTAELCHKMYRAGFRLLYLGLESGCDRVLDLMEKGTDYETALEVCGNVYNAGIWNHLYTFLGFPTESAEEAQQTIDFLITHKDIIRSFNIASFLLNRGAQVVRCPQKYGITAINPGPAPDFTLAYDYTVSSGLSCAEATEMSNIYREKVIQEYDNKEVFKLDYEEILLYLSHYRERDPSLKMLASGNTDTNVKSQALNQKSVPRLKNNITTDNLRFNIVAIVDNLNNNVNKVADPEPASIIFNSVSGQVLSVNPLVMEILSLCDGKRNVRQIAYTLAQKYDAPFQKVEADCISFLETFYKQGYIAI
ncbi:MAG: PqqD family peptide modification chaperone [Dehalococcoidales bacterium]|nr:PqqD family peptide modification chaperone [Dehalococcoidales bacterium]